MAIVFPASPSVNETFTAGSITYKWDGDKWIGLGVTPADRLIEGSNSLEINASNNLVWSGNNLGLGIEPAQKLHVKGNIKLHDGSTSAWVLYGGSDSTSYSQLDSHFGTTNRTLFFNENSSSNNSFAVWNRNSGSSGYGFGVDENNNFKVVSGANERFRVTSGGNVGIRNINPGRRLSITGVDQDFIELKHESRTGIHYIEHSGTNSETLAFLQNDGSTTNATARIGRSLTAFYRTYDGGTTDTEVFGVDADGNVSAPRGIFKGGRGEGSIDDLTRYDLNSSGSANFYNVYTSSNGDQAGLGFIQGQFINSPLIYMYGTANTHRNAINFGVLDSTGANPGSSSYTNRLHIRHNGIIVNTINSKDGTEPHSSGFYSKKCWWRQTFQSSINNPTVNLAEFSGGNTNNACVIKVRVIQVEFEGQDSSVGNEHVGMASIRKNTGGYSTFVNTMSISINNGNNNVGTLSWSGQTLRYTSNRTTNYDSYYVEIEICQNNQGNFTINLNT